MTASRPCPACNVTLKLPLDAIELVAPGSEGEDILIREREMAEKKPRPRKKYVRRPDEELVVSTKMRYLLTELLKASQRNTKSANYNGENPLDRPHLLDDDDLDEIQRTMSLRPTKSVVL